MRDAGARVFVSLLGVVAPGDPEGLGVLGDRLHRGGRLRRDLSFRQFLSHEGLEIKFSAFLRLGARPEGAAVGVKLLGNTGMDL